MILIIVELSIVNIGNSLRTRAIDALTFSLSTCSKVMLDDTVSVTVLPLTETGAYGCCEQDLFTLDGFRQRWMVISSTDR